MARTRKIDVPVPTPDTARHEQLLEVEVLDGGLELTDTLKKSLYNVFLAVKQKRHEVSNLSEELKIMVHVLSMQNYTPGEIMAVLNIPSRDIVNQILNDPTFNSIALNDLYDKAEQTFRRRLTQLSHTILSSINEQDIAKASLLQKTTAVSQFIDKSRLLAGKSTSNVAMAYDAANSLPKEANELEARINQLKSELGEDILREEAPPEGTDIFA